MSTTLRSLIKQKGVSIWLKADFGTIWERIQGKRTRPLLEVEDPKSTLKNLMKERAKIYKEADITVHSRKTGTHSYMVSKLIKLLSADGTLEQWDG